MEVSLSRTVLAVAVLFNTGVWAQENWFEIPPAAYDDYGVAHSPVTIDVLANDFDVDGDPLTITQASATNGDIVINPDQTVTYTPFPEFEATGGVEYATYEITDGQGGFASANIVITVQAPGEPIGGLVGHWTFDEGLGLVAGDSSGNGNDGTLEGGASWVQGMIGGAIALDGVTGRVVIPDSPSLSGLSQITVAAFVTPDSWGGGYEPVVAKGSSGGALATREFRLRNSGGSQMSWHMSPDGGDPGMTLEFPSVPVGQPSHVVATYDGATLAVYVDGQFVASGAGQGGAIFDSATELVVGNYYDGGGGFFDGAVDDLRIYDYAMTAQEAADLYASLTAPPLAPAEVAVMGPGGDITAGDDTPDAIAGTDFGTAFEGGAPVSRSFMVSNFGETDLLIGWPVQVPAGFLVTDVMDSMIPPGGSDSFTVELQTDAVGVFAGQVSFVNSDDDENPFTFSVTGEVQRACDLWVTFPDGQTVCAYGDLRFE